MTRRLPFLVVSTTALLGAGTMAASAAWIATGSGGSTAKSTAVPTGGTPTKPVATATTSVGTIVVEWPAANYLGVSPTTAVGGYLVKRYKGGVLDGTGPAAACAGTRTGLTCTDSVTATGSYTYTITPVSGASSLWTGTEGPASASYNYAPAGVTATQFAFTTAPVSGAASSSPTLGPITIERRSAGGAPVAAPVGGTVVNLSSSSTGTTRFAATSAGSSVTSVTIPAGSSSVSFYYADTKAGSPVITASGSLTSATQTETITAAAPALAFSTCATPVVKKSTFTTTVTRTGADPFGNPTGTAAITVTLAPFHATADNHNFRVQTVTLNAGSLASGSVTYYTANGATTSSFSGSVSGYISASCSVTTTN